MLFLVTGDLVALAAVVARTGSAARFSVNVLIAMECSVGIPLLCWEHAHL